MRSLRATGTEGGHGEPDRVAGLLRGEPVPAAGPEALGQGHAANVTRSYTRGYSDPSWRGSQPASPGFRWSSLSRPTISAMPDDQPLTPHGPLPEGGTVRPMTRWGTPVMHRPQQPVTSYDDGAARAGRRHGRDDVRRRRRRAGGLPDRRRPGGLRLRLPRRVGSAHGRASSATRCSRCPRGATGSSTTTTRAACPSRARSSTCARPDRATVHGLRPGRRARRVLRRRDAGPLPPARDRPHPRHRVRRPAPHQAPQEAPEAARQGRRGVPRRTGPPDAP